MTRDDFDAMASYSENDNAFEVPETFAERWRDHDFKDEKMVFLRHARTRLKEMGVERAHLVYRKTTTFGFVTKV